MFRAAFLDRAICVGVTFFVLVVGAQLYRWHVRSEIAAALARRTSAMWRLENRKAPHTAEDIGVPNLWDYAEALQALSPEHARDWELTERVCIESWRQAKRSESAAMENDLVYPCYENTAYVRWGEFIAEDGTPVIYIEELLDPWSVERYANDFDNDVIPSGIPVIRYDEKGIDPYAFLNEN